MVNIGILYSITRDWTDNLLCRFSNSRLSTQSFWFQNMNMWLLKLIFTHFWWMEKMNKVLFILLILFLSLTISSCKKSSSSSSSSGTTETDTSSSVALTQSLTSSNQFGMAKFDNATMQW